MAGPELAEVLARQDGPGGRLSWPVVLSARSPVRVTEPLEGPCSASVRRGLAVESPGVAEEFNQRGARGPCAPGWW